ncbi:hypothetical protein [Kitasatospora sp. McL0602]|uniref:hypothetical protein n=1 Tax=Kitasatospora sp. McL0602 TaxID=3439530 RepID=UPI003F8B90E0
MTDERAEGKEAEEGAEPVEGAPSTGGRRRTARLLVAALLLGPVLGAGVGYTVQATRRPTPLPPLQVSMPTYPDSVLDAKAAAEAAPKPLGIDGDLRKLLIAKPADAGSWDNYGRGDMSGWISPGEKAMTYGKADREFTSLLADGFRRDAIVAWEKNDVKYRIELIQYASDHTADAISSVNALSEADAHPLDGTSTGYYTAPATQMTYAESTEQYYYGRAVARRGDVVMRISLFSPGQVNADELQDLAKRQWERLA